MNIRWKHDTLSKVPRTLLYVDDKPVGDVEKTGRRWQVAIFTKTWKVQGNEFSFEGFRLPQKYKTMQLAQQYLEDAFRIVEENE